jgi:hypothetical protein
MKTHKFLAAFLLTLIAFVAVTAIEAPRKPKRMKEKIYVLPLVEEMPTNPTPFSL